MSPLRDPVRVSAAAVLLACALALASCAPPYDMGSTATVQRHPPVSAEESRVTLQQDLEAARQLARTDHQDAIAAFVDVAKAQGAPKDLVDQALIEAVRQVQAMTEGQPLAQRLDALIAFGRQTKGLDRPAEVQRAPTKLLADAADADIRDTWTLLQDRRQFVTAVRDSNHGSTYVIDASLFDPNGSLLRMGDCHDAFVRMDTLHQSPNMKVLYVGLGRAASAVDTFATLDAANRPNHQWSSSDIDRLESACNKLEGTLQGVAQMRKRVAEEN